MRLSRPIALAILAAVLTVPATGHATVTHAGAWIYINPAVKRNAVDFTSWAKSTGGVLGSYAAQWTVTGTITGQGYVTAIDDSWTLLMMSPGSSSPEHHAYPAGPVSTIALVYTGWVFAAGSGVPTVYCQSVLTRVGAAPPSIVGSC
jgi:hypothetical protein